jgi:hypothetical protein
MRPILRLVALLLVYLMTPVATEVAENVVHFVVNGHGAHALQDSEHHPNDREHGCSGLVHVCACHSSTPFAVDRSTVEIAAKLAVERELEGDDDAGPRPGHTGDVFRPPLT